MDLASRVAVVTGGAAGCGRAICRRFAAEGATVVVSDIDADGAAAVADDIGGVAIAADVASESDNAELVAQTLDRFGRLDVFCANAGIMWGPGDGDKATLGDISAPVDAWRRVWEVNVLAVSHGVKAVLPHWLDRGEGYLVTHGSAAGVLNAVGNAPYASSKHACVGLSEWLAITYGDSGIRVSCILSEGVRTDMLVESHGEWFATAGAVEPEVVADALVEGMRTEQFAVYSHPNTARYFRGKAADYERWIVKMRRLAAKTPHRR